MDEIAAQIDRLENLAAALELPMPDRIHVQAFREALPDVIAELKAGYIAAGGDNHWEFQP